MAPSPVFFQSSLAMLALLALLLAVAATAPSRVALDGSQLARAPFRLAGPRLATPAGVDGDADILARCRRGTNADAYDGGDHQCEAASQAQLRSPRSLPLRQWQSLHHHHHQQQQHQSSSSPSSRLLTRLFAMPPPSAVAVAHPLRSSGARALQPTQLRRLHPQPIHQPAARKGETATACNGDGGGAGRAASDFDQPHACGGGHARDRFQWQWQPFRRTLDSPGCADPQCAGPQVADAAAAPASNPNSSSAATLRAAGAACWPRAYASFHLPAGSDPPAVATSAAIAAAGAAGDGDVRRNDDAPSHGLHPNVNHDNYNHTAMASGTGPIHPEPQPQPPLPPHWTTWQAQAKRGGHADPTRYTSHGDNITTTTAMTTTNTPTKHQNTLATHDLGPSAFGLVVGVVFAVVVC